MKPLRTALITLLIGTTSLLNAQEKSDKPLRWRDVATNAPDAWYGSAESKEVAANVLFVQTQTGGWPKNIELAQPLTDHQKMKLKQNLTSSEYAPNIDNGATVEEMIFLAKMYSSTLDESYRKAWDKGFNYLIEAQYDNGGWPQFYPLRPGYSRYITYNDNAMMNVMDLLYDVMRKKEDFPFASDEQAATARKAFDKGIECVLKTQIVVNGEPTVWCAQHDEVTYAPARARAYELPSFSGSESVGILRILMKVSKPSPEVVRSVEGAIKWLNSNKLVGVSQEWIVGEDGIRRRTLVENANATPLWARFYDLESALPFFSDRDSVKVYSLEELGLERRNGYGWYTEKPLELINELYPKWRAKNKLD